MKLINLLPEVSDQQRVKDSRLWLFNVIAVCFLLGIIAVLAGMYTYKLVISNRMSADNRRIDQTEQAIKADNEVSNLAFFLDSKFKKLRQNLPKLDHRFDINQVNDLVPPGMLITDYSQEEDGLITLAGSTPDPDLIQTFFDELLTRGKDNFTRFNVKTINIENTGEYTFVITFSRK